MVKNDTNPFRDRPYGEMGVGKDSGAQANWEGDKPARPNEVADGWKSNSASLPLYNGSTPTTDSNTSTDSGPAWPSNSKDRK